MGTGPTCSPQKLNHFHVALTEDWQQVPRVWATLARRSLAFGTHRARANGKKTVRHNAPPIERVVALFARTCEEGEQRFRGRTQRQTVPAKPS